VWSPDGHLLFSDPDNNLIYRWTSDGQVSVHRTKSGYAGADAVLADRYEGKRLTTRTI